MLKKIMLVILAAVLVLAAVESLTAQPGTRGRDFGGRRGRGFSAAPQQSGSNEGQAQCQCIYAPAAGQRAQ